MRIGHTKLHDVVCIMRHNLTPTPGLALIKYPRPVPSTRSAQGVSSQGDILLGATVLLAGEDAIIHLGSGVS